MSTLAGTSALRRSDWRETATLAVISAALSTLAWLAAGDVALPPLDERRVIVVGSFTFVFTAALLISWCIAHVARLAIGLFTPGSGPGRATLPDPIPGLAAVAVASYGIAGAQSLSEVYRASPRHWLDPMLWSIERPLFAFLRGFDAPSAEFWDFVYFALWPLVLACAAVLYRQRRIGAFHTLLLSVVLSFYLTRLFALVLPTAGPAFHMPSAFAHLHGSLSAAVQESLLEYMQGRVGQNGLIPGTMAMPSLHVALITMVAVVLFRQWRATVVLTAPSVALTWIATVVLGWHYAVDGVGGVIVALGSLAIASWIIDRLLAKDRMRQC